MRKVIVSSLLMLTLSTPAFAQDKDSSAITPQEGRTVLAISATETKEVPQDLLITSLRYEAEGKDAKAVQNEINNAMKKALEKAKAVPGLTIFTEQYYVYPHETYEPRPANGQPQKVKEKIWRGSQSIQIQGKDSDVLLTLVGQLQDSGLLVNSLTYTLSPEKAEDIKDSLIEAALIKLKTRAERAAKALGHTKTELVEVSVDSAQNFGHAPMMARSMDMAGGAMEKAAAPIAEPGKTEISLNVSARALLKP